MKRKLSPIRFISAFLAVIIFLLSFTVVNAVVSDENISISSDTYDTYTVPVSTEIQKGSKGYVNDYRVNLRSGPGTGYTIITCMDIYTPFTFIDDILYNSQWYQVKLNDGTSGYIYYEYASVSDEYSNPVYGYVNDDYVNIRSGAGTDYSPIDCVRIYTEFEFLSTILYNDLWYYIRTTDGTEGYIYKEYVSFGNVSDNEIGGGDVDISDTFVSLGKGKSILLTSYDDVNWKSSDTSIATVDDGVVYAKNEGKTVITAYNSYGSANCVVTVKPPEAIRFVYATPNSVPLNTQVKLNAITDSDRCGLYFVITNGSNSYTVSASSLKVDGSNYIWSGYIKLTEPGKWTYKAYSLYKGSNEYLTTEDNGEGEVFVTQTVDRETTSCSERRASDDVIELIADYESFLPELTPDYITGDPTIGYGKVIYSGEQFYNDLTEVEAYAYLCQTINNSGFTSKVNKFLLENDIKFNQQQFDALVCFSYNMGASAIENDEELMAVLLNTSGSGSDISSGASGYINDYNVNLRNGPGTDYSIVAVMDEYTKITFVDATVYNSNWYKIRLANGTTGYIYKTYVSTTGGGRDLNNTKKDDFLSAFLQYHHASGSCYKGLLYRRVDEAEVFFDEDYIRDGEYNKFNYRFTCKVNSDFGIY